MDSSGVQATALLAGSFLSGAMTSLSLIAVPVFLDTTEHPPQLLHQWARMYSYGHKALPTMSVGVCILHLYMAASKKRRVAQGRRRGGRVLSALAGVSTVLMLPFTWFFMVPTNNELFRLEALSRMEPPGVLDVGVAGVKGMIGHWAQLHAIRCLFPLAGAILGIFSTF